MYLFSSSGIFCMEYVSCIKLTELESKWRTGEAARRELEMLAAVEERLEYYVRVDIWKWKEIYLTFCLFFFLTFIVC